MISKHGSLLGVWQEKGAQEQMLQITKNTKPKGHIWQRNRSPRSGGVLKGLPRRDPLVSNASFLPCVRRSFKVC